MFVAPRPPLLASGNNGSVRGHKIHCFPEISINKCFIGKLNFDFAMSGLRMHG